MTARAAADRAARDHHARLLALLAARTRDLAAAEDALAQAFRAALESWPRTGIPDRPEAWLMTAAKRAAGAARARAATVRDAMPTLILLTDEEQAMPAAIPDHRLGLMFACTHPALDPAVQTPLMLQCVLGLTADRIAPAFLMTRAALGQRLSRAKARLKAEGAAFAIPEADEIAPRLAPVMEAVLAAAALGWEGVPGSDPARADLASEAVHLAEVLAGLAPDRAEPRALLSLILHVQARRAARAGGYVPLSEQDVALWDHAMIDAADGHLAAAGALGQLGRFQLEAAIQSVHAERRRTGRTNWLALFTLHAALQRLAPSLGGAVAQAAVAMEVTGPAAALEALDRLAGTERFQPTWALRAEALSRLRRWPEAEAARATALGLAEDPGLRDWLARRRSGV
ncbi:MAG: RNA polymerase sigma factor [Gemmobacter sp.]